MKNKQKLAGDLIRLSASSVIKKHHRSPVVYAIICENLGENTANKFVDKAIAILGDNTMSYEKRLNAGVKNMNRYLNIIKLKLL